MDTLDDFSLAVRNKIEHCEHSISDSTWNAIDSRVNSRHRPIVTLLKWSIPIAAAVLTALFLILKPSAINHTPLISEVEYKSLEEEKVDADLSKNNDIKNIEKKIEITTTENRLKSKITNNKATDEKVTNTLSTSFSESGKEENLTQTEKDKTADAILNKTENDPVTKEVETSTEKSANTSSSQKQKQQNINFNQEREKQKILAASSNNSFQKKKGRENINILVALNSGAPGIVPHQTQNDAFANDGDLSNKPPFHDETNPKEEEANTVSDLLNLSDKMFLPPLSLSVMAEFPVNNRLSLVTGVRYTYLLSKFGSKSSAHGTTQLHYVGVPLHLKYTVWQHQGKSLYLVAGGSIEKGIYALYTLKNSNGLSEQKTGRSISGIQTSMEGGIGFNYSINPNIKLFVEPQLQYYFDHKQPISMRTESPLCFGLNAGIRISLQ